jgi:hypothetical protein
MLDLASGMARSEAVVAAALSEERRRNVPVLCEICEVYATLSDLPEFYFNIIR